MTARLAGGRTPLHLAAQMRQVSLVKELVERSAYNKAKTEEEKRNMEEAFANKETDSVRLSSEDDWSSDESDDEKPHRKPPEPDIIDISTHGRDFGLTALGYAILSGSREVVGELLAAGADPNFVAQAKNVKPLHPLALTIYTQDEERGAMVAERLIAAREISSMADNVLFIVFHRIVAAGKTKIAASLLEHDPDAKKVLNYPAWYCFWLVLPNVSIIEAGDYATLSPLLAHGAKISFLLEDISRSGKRTFYVPSVTDYRGHIYLPIETALGQCDEVIVISLLAALDAPEGAGARAHGQTSREAFNSPLMLAAKRGNVTTSRTILEFGIDPTRVVHLPRYADGSTPPLHVAVQKEDQVVTEILLKYGPTQPLYTENGVGQTPLDIASLKYLRTPPKARPFNVEKQKIEILKLRATLNMLLADGHLVHGSKLMTELPAFADRIGRRLAEETARNNASENQADDGELDSPEQQGSTTRTYFALREAVAAWAPRDATAPEGTFDRWSQLSRATDEEDKEAVGP
ncbi:ankyrin repeat-containing domain protein [Lactarius quietus]|nr:ankyrin repeat-containing domain protein [Lactarius quietus]